MTRPKFTLRMITTAVTLGAFILSASMLAMTSVFVALALKQAASTPEGAQPGRTESVNMILLEKTLEAFKKKTSAPAIGGTISNPFATPAPAAPPVTPVQ
ncbi:hypothetical protein HY633_02485 [Candidatus Uhrbacteria bacterium]|nr:hypothetical protein [Candidatus Uhrbacteria bacterium]